MRVMKAGGEEATPIVVSDEVRKKEDQFVMSKFKFGKLFRGIPGRRPKSGGKDPALSFDDLQSVSSLREDLATMEQASGLTISTSLPASPSLMTAYHPLQGGDAENVDGSRQRKSKGSRKKKRNNNVLTSDHPALISNPKPLSYVVTKDSVEGELLLTLDRNGVTVEAFDGNREFLRTPVLSVPWYRVKSYEKHIKGHRFALVYQHMSRSRPDKIVLRRVVYNTDESEIIFKAMKRYIGWVAYHS